MSSSRTLTNESMSVAMNPERQGRLFVRIEEGHWYASLPEMAAAMKKIGAVVEFREPGQVR